MRLPLGVKMTLASTLLVAVLVTVLGYLHALKIRDVHDARAAEMRDAFTQMAARRAESSATVLAIALREALEGTELGTLSSVVNGLVEQDPEVRYARVADRRGRVLADSTRPIDAGDLPQLEQGTEAAAATSTMVERESANGVPVLEIRQPIVATIAGQPEVRGLVIFGFDLSRRDEKLAAIDAARRDGTRESLRSTFLIDGIALILGALLSLLAAQRFAAPIRRLASTAARISQGDLDARVAVTTSDEVGTLGLQFNHMAGRVRTLLEEAVAKAELERELNLAREIQSVLVPGPGRHEAPGIAVAGYYEPASSCGGDFWDFAPLPRGRTAIFVGDVTGHGVPAAMLTATAKACIDTLREVHGENFQVAETMRVLDRIIRDTGRGNFFMTAVATVLDSAQSTLFFTGAAHPPGLLLRWTESGMKLHRLMSRGNRLGDGTPGGFETKRIRVEAGDLLVWYTDGLTECYDAQGTQFGTRRLLRCLSRLDASATPEQVVSLLEQELLSFRAGVALEDDVTFVVGKVQ
ncbi:MAG: SpoIIE family protein phosphatase [Deltaproteobacteria bacterium]|nr:SpoIIE family protein phosphatase [Deltaproteobacteria bacterium]MCB9788095.1 SpoIIE family protein phosphatase [Deltaproteobacteria bacterium]